MAKTGAKLGSFSRFLYKIQDVKGNKGVRNCEQRLGVLDLREVGVERLGSQKHLLAFKLSSFSRSFATEAGLILANSLFISSFGANNWPQLFLFAQFITTTFLFASLTVTEKAQSYGYRAIVWATIIGCVFVGAGPSHQSIIYLVCGFLLCFDLLAGSVTYQFVSRAYPLAESRVLNQVVTEQELWGRVAGTLAVSALTFAKLTLWSGVLIALFATLHLLTFMYLQVRASTKYPSLSLREKSHPTSFDDNVQSSIPASMLIQLRSLTTSRLFLVAVGATLLAQIFKFFVSYSFFKSLENQHQSIELMTMVISQINLVAIGISIIIQKLLSHRWLLNKTPRFLYALTPVLLGSIAFLSYWFDSVSLIAFQFIALSCINKVIQAPSTRHTLMAIPQARERNVIYASSIFVALAMLIWSFSAEQFRSLLTIERSQAAIFSVSVFALYLFRRINFYYYMGLLESVFGPYKKKKKWLSRQSIEEVERGRLVDEFLKASPERAVELTPFLKRRFKGFEGSAYLKYQLKAIEEAYLTGGFHDLTSLQRAHYLRILYLFALKHLESTGFWAVDEMFRRVELESLDQNIDPVDSYDEQMLYLFYEFFLQSNERAPLRSVKSAMVDSSSSLTSI